MADRLGQQFGNYRLTRFLGAGGFAEVYLGQHIRLSTQQAAIKILTARLQDEHTRMFEQEAETIASLVHPHIVRLLDFDIAEGVPFFVMDYAAHGSLRQRHSAHEQVPLPTVVAYVNAVASALQYAHERKIIHRDVKPDNMLITENDEIVLSDFGIAAIAHSTASQNAQGIEGTVPYMAPEQFQAHARFASDQYALAIAAYEWLAGDRPFIGSFSEVAVKHALVTPPPLHERRPELSPEVAQVVMTALAKDPRERFASVEAFAHALEQASQSAQSGKERAEPGIFHGQSSLAAADEPTYLADVQSGPTLQMFVEQTPRPPVSPVPATYNDVSPIAEQATVAQPVPVASMDTQITPSSPFASPATGTPVSFSAPTISERAFPVATPPPHVQPKRKSLWKVALLVLLILLIVGGGSYALLSSLQRGPNGNAVQTNGTPGSQGGTAVVSQGTSSTGSPGAMNSSTPTSTGTAPASPSTPGAGTTATAPSAPATPATPTASTGGGTGVTASGSVSSQKTYFLQEEVSYANTTPITFLRITITIIKTSGVSYNGETASGSGIVSATYTDEGSRIVYAYTLNAGSSLAPGRYHVLAQVNLPGSSPAHSPGGDSWSIITTSGGVTHAQGGYF